MLHLLSANYLFNKALGPFNSTLAWVFLFGLVGMVVLSVLFSASTKQKDIFWRKSAKKFSSFAWTMSLLGLILWLFRQVNVLYLSAPVLLLAWLVIALVWFAGILYYLFIKAPKRRAQLMVESKKKTYIP